MQRVQDGAEQLQQWLEDLVRAGLAAAARQPDSFWESEAARLVDAQAPGLARMVHESAIPTSNPKWKVLMLDQLARIYLVLAAFKHIESLPGPIQQDVRTLIGWTQDQKDLLKSEGVRDEWTVLGQRTAMEDRLQVQRTWLRGARSDRLSLVLTFAYGNQAPFSGLIPGTCFEGELVFFPGQLALRALVKARDEATKAISHFPGESISAVVRRWADAKTRHPWLQIYPVRLQQVIPAQQSGNWVFVDGDTYHIRIDPARDIWKLLAVSGGHPVDVFGEWNGALLTPVSIFADGRLIELN